MLHGLQLALGLSPDAVKAALVLGGGVAGSQSICGALNAGAVALGLSSPDISPDADARRALTAKARTLWQAFESAHGALDCRTLTGFDFRQSGEYAKFAESSARKEKCPELVTLGVIKVLELNQG